RSPGESPPPWRGRPPDVEGKQKRRGTSGPRGVELESLESATGRTRNLDRLYRLAPAMSSAFDTTQVIQGRRACAPQTGPSLKREAQRSGAIRCRPVRTSVE